jgi:calcium-dependent protein kinase
MLLSGVPPYWGRSNSEILQQVAHHEHPLFTEACWADLPEDCVDFVRRLLQRDPTKRPTAAEALKHPWLKGVENAGESARCDQKVLSSLRTFAQHTPVKRCALSLIAAHLSHGGNESLEEQFHRLDFEHHGSIDQQEFTQVFARELGGTEQEAIAVFKSLDCLGEQEIHYTEFLAATEHTLLTEGYLREAFRWFDQDDDGYISRSDLWNMLGDEVQGKGVDEVLAMLDMKHQGKVDTDDWLEFMLRVDCDRSSKPRKDPEATPLSSQGSTCLPQSPRSLAPSVAQSCVSECQAPCARQQSSKVLLPTIGDSDSGDCDGEDCDV